MALSVPNGGIGAEGTMRPSPGVEHLLDLIARHRPAWHADAACLEHPELDWYDDTIAGMAAAAAVCAGCGVAEECRAAALDRPERHGVWGGLTPRERGAAGQKAARPAAPAHGTRAAYNRGCRCDDCRGAAAAAQRERRAGLRAS